MRAYLPNQISAVAAFALALLLCGATLQAQANFTLSLSAPHNSSFNTGPAGTAANLTNLVRSEPLALGLSSTPTASALPPAQLQPRRIALWLGAEDTTPTIFPMGAVFLNLAGSPPAVPLFDSFTQPWAPMFATPLGNGTSTINLTLGADLFGPLYSAALPTMALQAYCEDTPGNPILLSNAVRFQIIDPETAGFAPAFTDIQPQALSGTGVLRPQGSELGGNVVVISGSNLLAQSNWITRPPKVFFGSQQATQVAVMNNTTLWAVVPPTLAPTNAPATNAGLVNVTIQNNLDISPAAAVHTAPQQYLYLSGQTPNIIGTTGQLLPPEGGVFCSLLGSGFLNNATVTLQSVNNPSIITSLQAGAVGAGGTILSFVMPPFCTGPVSCTVTNVDEVRSTPFLLNVAEQAPQLVSGSPNMALHSALGGGTHMTVSAAGSNLTIVGAGFLTANSPLASAATVPAALFHPTRARLDGTLLANVQPQNTVILSGAVPSVAANGLFRPALGARTLVLENPPCVATGNANVVTNTPCATGAAPCTVLVQDVAPPQAASFFPGIVPDSGISRLRISGGNFFSVENGTTSVDYSPFATSPGVITALPLSALRVPAVLIGSRFATRVTLLSETELEIVAPPQSLGSSVILAVTVFNPDGQQVVLSMPLTVAPALTNPSSVTTNLFADLDEDALAALAAGVFVAGGDPSGNDAPAMLLVRNPTPQRDQAEDPFATALPANTSYDFALLLNTRTMNGAAREFAFNNIDLPATLTLPGGGSAFVAPLDAAIPVGGTATIAPGTTLRVIVKACGFDRDFTGRWSFDSATNHPLILAAHDTFRVDALVNLSGGALVPESLLATHPHRVRVERTFVAAGGGAGGRGGSHGTTTALTLPAPNFTATAAALAGSSGAQPADRSPQALPGVQTEGLGGNAAVPVGILAGGGGGAGHAAAGANGHAGSVAGGSGGVVFGNFTFPGANPLGTPPLDCYVYGSTPADFQLFSSGLALSTGKISGGSGGGGGGGATALFVPAQSLGGRGGNGGGALVLLANCVLELGAHAVLRCDGEQGQIGVDVFPFAGSAPTLPVCLPGAGGGGSGGTILVFALAHVCLSGGGPAGCGTATAALPSTAFISARAGLAGPPSGVVSAGSTAGGGGAHGRVRFATRANSPHQLQMEAAYGALLQQGLIAPAPTCSISMPSSFFLWQGY